MVGAIISNSKSRAVMEGKLGGTTVKVETRKEGFDLGSNAPEGFAKA